MSTPSSAPLPPLSRPRHRRFLSFLRDLARPRRQSAPHSSGPTNAIPNIVVSYATHTPAQQTSSIPLGFQGSQSDLSISTSTPSTLSSVSLAHSTDTAPPVTTTADASQTAPQPQLASKQRSVMETAVNGLLVLLKDCAKDLPVPGIGAAVGFVAECIERNRIVSKNAEAVLELKCRVEKIQSIGIMTSNAQSLCPELHDSLHSAFKDLSLGISEAGYAARMFNARDDEAVIQACNENLNRILQDFHVAVSVENRAILRSIGEKLVKEAKQGATKIRQVHHIGDDACIIAGGDYASNNESNVLFEGHRAFIKCGGMVCSGNK